MSEMVRLTGLWLNESKAGEKYFAGNLGTARIMMFKNKFKSKDTDPDYVLNIAPKKDREQQEDNVVF